METWILHLSTLEVPGISLHFVVRRTARRRRAAVSAAALQLVDWSRPEQGVGLPGRQTGSVTRQVGSGAYEIFQNSTTTFGLAGVSQTERLRIQPAKCRARFSVLLSLA